MSYFLPLYFLERRVAIHVNIFPCAIKPDKIFNGLSVFNTHIFYSVTRIEQRKSRYMLKKVSKHV